MNTQFTGHNVEVTQALREFTERKLKKLTHKRNYITNIHITFNIDKLIQIAEASISVPGHIIHAKAESNEMYQAVDELIDKLIRQVNKYRDKQIEHR